MKQENEESFKGSASGVSSNALAFLTELEGDPALAKRLRTAIGGKRSWPRWQVWTTAALVSVFTGVTGVAAAPGVDEFFTFNGGTPARASEVNANFALTQTWLEEKSGPVCNGSPCNTSISGNATINGNTTTGGTVALGGLLTLSSDSVDTDSNTNGCSRVGLVQTCWYQVNATDGSGTRYVWGQPFANDDYVVVATAEASNDGRIINVWNINNGNATFGCRGHDGDGETCRAHVIAIGRAGSGW